MAINTILFDLGGVLIDWNPRYLFQHHFEEEAEMEYFLTEICSPSWNHQMDEGKPFAEAVKELAAEHPKYAHYIHLYAERWKDMLNGTIKGTEEILYQLTRSGKYRMLALTNWSAETIPVAYRRFDFFGCFESVLVSGDVKLAKPDAAIFHHLISAYKVTPEQTLFIDDAEANITTSKSLNFPSIQFKNPKQLGEELNALDIFY